MAWCRHGLRGKVSSVPVVETPTVQLPPVPLTLEGASVLHQMMRVRWSAWNALPEITRKQLAGEASAALAALEQEKSALFSLIGHKGDLLLVHFRSSFEDLNRIELQLARLGIS